MHLALAVVYLQVAKAAYDATTHKWLLEGMLPLLYHGNAGG
jgi:hypothetical protein